MSETVDGLGGGRWAQGNVLVQRPRTLVAIASVGNGHWLID